MPDQPIWLDRVADILVELEAPASPPFLDRPAVELLFGLRRRQAIELMHHMAGYQVGRTFLVERAAVCRFLNQPAVRQATARAAVRKRRVLEYLAAARRDWPARKLRIPVDPAPQSPGLPAGVELRPGQLTIRFDQPVELLQKLFALSRALANDCDRDRLLQACADASSYREQAAGNDAE